MSYNFYNLNSNFDAFSFDRKTMSFTDDIQINKTLLYVDIPPKSIAFISAYVSIRSISSNSTYGCWLSDSEASQPRYGVFENFIDSNDLSYNNTISFASVSAYDNSDNEQSKRVYLQAYSNNCTVNGIAEISFMSVKKP